ncbi:MAG: amino acid--tRNA ligase-related protein [Patescibacteria group bacterium]|nr:amino acid--tRNA ligase-related protein [Patescibacteria group bacterium]
MVYSASENGNVKYLGNKIFPACDAINNRKITQEYLDQRFASITTDQMFYHLSQIDNAIFQATVEYFIKRKAQWANLPLTTRMISSPGEVYAGQTLDYTTDTLPVELPNWFDTNKRLFLAESSQFYLELQLMIPKIDQVFSIYNSFRKEEADYTHLTEFQHIEYEGKVGFEENKQVAIELLDYIIEYIGKNNRENLEYFLSEEDIQDRLQGISNNLEVLTFKEAMDILYADTKDEKYKEFSLKNFGSWEEVRLTEIIGKHVSVEKFPMLQIPFYHAIAEETEDGIPLAKNADIILAGYRETVGAGSRIIDKETLMKKADIFNLPKEDYLPYLVSRDNENYTETAGFGLGWQRLVQWLLKMPTIVDSTVFPRTHLTPNP